MSDEELKKAQFFFDFVAKVDHIAEKSNERLSKKIHGTLTVVSGMIPLVFGFGYFILAQTKEWVVFIPLFLSIIMFLLALVRGILLLKPKWFLYVDVLEIINKYKDEPLTYIINKSAVTWADTVNHNISVVNSREKGLSQILILVALGLIVLAVTFLTLGISMLNS